VTGAETDAALDAALALGADGWFCFPCMKDKRPATPHGFKQARGDPNGLRELWRQYPGPLIGVATGAASAVDVLDLDRKHLEAGAWWDANRDRLRQTRCHRTRSGGLHLLFRHAVGLRSTAGKIAPGVDTRGDGGYIIWWPAAGLPVLSDVSPAPWPAWLLAQLETLPDRPRKRPAVIIPDDRALGRLVRVVAGAPEGQRNNFAFWAACRAGEMARSGLIGLETAASVIAAAAMRAGLSQQEAERTARSGVHAGAGVANV
jgi:Bifunctional DNA primase/polymerase, N-terminal